MISEKVLKLNKQNKLLSVLQEWSIFLILIILIVISSLISKSFFTLENLLNILRQISIIGIVACGLTFCFVSGNLDLSVGSIISLTGMIVMGFLKYNLILAIFITLIAGIIAGSINGFLIGKLKANALVTTLGMQSAFAGLAFLYTKGHIILGDPKSPFTTIGRGYLFKVPVPIIIFFITVIITYVILHRTTYGRYVFATGANKNVATASGIRVGNIVFSVFAISGFCCAIAAMILSSRIISGYPDAGGIYLFDSLTAVVVGGTSIFGGKGNIFKTFIGVLIIGVLGNLLAMLGLNTAFQQILKGIILIIAVLIDTFSRRNE